MSLGWASPLWASSLKENPFDDWQPTDDCASLCKGNYIEAPPPFPGKSEAALAKEPIEATADSAELPKSGPVLLRGGVHVIEGNRQLFGNKAILERNQSGKLSKGDILGNVELLEPGMRVEGTQASFNQEKDIKTIENADYRLYTHHARGTADKIVVQGKSCMTLYKATYTTCAPRQNTWELRASKVKLNKVTGRGRAYHSRLYVKDIPIFYSPFLDFPIDDRRETGFLYPSFGMSKNSGKEFTLPFYWNMAPNYDSTFTGRYLSERGLEGTALFRYLSRNTVGEIEGTFLPNDKKYKKFQQETLAFHPTIPKNDPRLRGLKGDANRAFLRFRHGSQFNPNLSTLLQYQEAGDDNYFYDFGDTLEGAATVQLLQQGELFYRDQNWNNALRVRQYQTLHPVKGPGAGNVYRLMPQLTLVNNFMDLPWGLQTGMSANLTRFDIAPNPYTYLPLTRGNRFQVRPYIMLPIMHPGWFLKPRLQWDFLGDAVTLSKFDERFLSRDPTRQLPMFDVDSGLIFERLINFRSTPYIQTLEPRLYYLYVPYKNQNNIPIFDTAALLFEYNQLFRDNRFSGFDRIGDANQLTYAVSTRFLTAKGGAERLSATVGQIAYFRDRVVTACNPNQPGITPNCIRIENPNHKKPFSNIAGASRLRINHSWSGLLDAEWNPYLNTTEKTGLTLQYHPDEENVVNIGYQYLRRNLNQINPKTRQPFPMFQTDLSFAWKIAEDWRVIGRWHYDHKNNRPIDTLVGLEYQGCCTAVRFSVFSFLEPKYLFVLDVPSSRTATKAPNMYQTGFQIQFVFKGFGNVGQKAIQKTLTSSIPGYVWRGERF